MGIDFFSEGDINRKLKWWWWLLFFFNFYNGVLVSALKQCKSAIIIHIFPPL